MDSQTESSSDDVVRVCGSSWNQCGYCKGARSSIVKRPPSDSSKVYTMHSIKMKPASYERLVQLSWRRSGMALYKPRNDVSCCPNISIRLAVQNFEESKSQKKVRRKAHALLNPTSDTKSKSNIKMSSERIRETLVRESGVLTTLSNTASEILQSLSREVTLEEPIDLPMSIPFRLQTPKKKIPQLTAVTTICARLAGLSKGVLDKAKLSQRLAEDINKKLLNSSNGSKSPKKQRISSDPGLVSFDRAEAHAKSGQVLVHLNVETPEITSAMNNGEAPFSGINDHENRLKAWFSERYPSVDIGQPPYQISVETLSSYDSALLPEVHRLYFEYQHHIHGDPDPFQDTDAPVDLEWGREEVNEYMTQVKSMLRDLYGHLSETRQNIIDTAFGTFFDFLVDSPFPRSTSHGTFHQHYRIGTVLVAVGVVDILPDGLSSVYLFYSPSMAKDLVPLGKLASLMEIDYTKSRKLKYYYLGYYIESCYKMRYKADYRPSQLLCPVTFRWVDATAAQKRLLSLSPHHNYCKLYDGDEPEETGESAVAFQQAMKGVRMNVGVESLVTLDMLHENGQEIVGPFLHEFVECVTPSIATHFVVDFQ